jgi:predicted TIM-barrel fold metal-dependent hydrolase
MAKSKFPWLKLGKKTDPELPLEPPAWFGNISNGEYFHQQTKAEKKLRKEILNRADDQARYLGMDRREFLASTMGMALTMTVINEVTACSSDSNAAGPGKVGGGDGGPMSGGDGGPMGGGKYGTKGPYVVPPEATCDPSAYINVDGSEGHEFIMDVQTHSFDKGEWRQKQVAYPIFLGVLPGDPNCKDADHLDCFYQDHYAELMFVDSDTTMTVITSWPAAQCYPERKLLGNDAFACGLPLSNEGMRDLRNWVNERAMSQRVINQVQVMPNDQLEHQLAGMEAAISDSGWKCGSWKAYPAWRSDNYPDANGGASGYYMTDPVGRAFIEHGLKLGVPNFAIHKGLPIPGFDVIHNEPTDIGTIAVDYQAANFVIYHSAINAGTGGGVLAAVNPTSTEAVPYTSQGDVTGVNMLIRDLIDKKLIDDPDSPGTKISGLRLNVFAEMGSAWSQVMLKTDRSAEHYMGKLLKYLGEDNIVWGTDCILSGSPQAQIDLFRKFTIGADFQQQYGYPEITPAIKAKIFGLNAAKLYRIDPTAARCKADANTFAMIKRRMDEELGGRRWAVKGPLGPRTLKEFWENARVHRAKGVPG